MFQVKLVIHGAAPCLVNVGGVDDVGDTILDVCHLECGLFEVKDEPGAENVRPWQVLPTILCIQQNRRSCQLLHLGDFIQSIGHHELGDVGVRANCNQNCRRLLRGR